jgi:hypothetical protein
MRFLILAVPSSVSDEVTWSRGANVTHTFVVQAVNTGAFPNEPARVSYRSGSTKAPVQSVFSTKLASSRAFHASQSEQFRTPQLENWAIFLALAAAASAVPFMTWYNIQGKYNRGIKRE